MKTWHLAAVILGLGLVTGFGVVPSPAATMVAPSAVAAHTSLSLPPPAPPPPPPPASAASGPGVVYSYAQLEGALAAAGVGAWGQRTGAAVAEAESHGASGAVCHNCVPGYPEYSVGPWQINLNVHNVSQACAMELYCGARAAAGISGRGTNWHPWSTYQNGAFLRYLQ